MYTLLITTILIGSGITTTVLDWDGDLSSCKVAASNLKERRDVVGGILIRNAICIKTGDK